MLFSMVAVPFYIPANSAQAFQFLRVLAGTLLMVAILMGERCSFCFLRNLCLFRDFTRNRAQ